MQGGGEVLEQQLPAWVGRCGALSAILTLSGVQRSPYIYVKILKLSLDYSMIFCKGILIMSQLPEKIYI